MKIEIWKNYFDVVILPPKNVANYAISLSKKLKLYNSHLLLGKKSFLPHISLYHIPVKQKNFKKFILELENLLKGFKPGLLEINGLKLYKYHSSICLMTDKPAWIKKLCSKIIKTTLKYGDFNKNIIKKWKADKLPMAMQKNIKKYGTPLMGKNFIPHITLGVFKNQEDMIKGFDKLKFKKFKFKPQKLYICQLGQSHSCQRIIRVVSF